MRIPRDLTGRGLVTALAKLGYEVPRQTGSHMRLTTERNGTHHVTYRTIGRSSWARFPPS